MSDVASEMVSQVLEEKPKRPDSELASLAEALEAALREPTGENYKKMLAGWEALPETKKAATRKPVLWAYCAMLASKGHLGTTAKWKESIDYPGFLRAVSEQCYACGGEGRTQEACRTCGGSGVKWVRCGNCNGSGRCSFCHGSGRVGGVLGGSPARCPRCGGTGRCYTCSDGRNDVACSDCKGGSLVAACRTCNGTGRIVDEYKCERVVAENLREALRICRETKVAEGGEQASPVQSRGEVSSPFQAALQAARNHPNLGTFEHLETVLDTLSDEEKAVLQTPVMTAFCAMLLAADNRSGLSARMKFVNYRSLLQSVKTPCEACGGDGRIGQTCTECGGTGKCKYCHGSGLTVGHLTGRKMPCPTCNSNGRCPACQGGTVQIQCKTCSGSGRALSKAKCQEVMKQNLDEALRLFLETR